jgi:outer membrane lipoprotein-sorting protein
MKKSARALLLGSVVCSSATFAITPDELVSGYFSATGGVEAWSKLNGVRYTGELKQGNMSFPFILVQLKDGRSYFQFEVQGKTLKQNVWDGKQLWSTNFLTMKAELADAEATANHKLSLNDFPDALFDYKQKGYTLEVLGEESKEGTEVYKVKLVKEPVTVDGKTVADVSFYYFDKQALVPLVQEEEVKSGPGKGMIAEVKFGEYQEVDGLIFPFSIAQGVKDGQSAPMIIKKVEINPAVTDADFAMPAVQ